MRVAVVAAPRTGRHEIAAFRDDFVSGHGVFGGAAHSLDMLAKVRPIGERDLNDCLASRNPALEFAILDELYLRALPQNFRILHARLVMGRLNEAVLSISMTATMCCRPDIRQFPVVHNGCFVSGNPHIHGLHLVRAERMLLE